MHLDQRQKARECEAKRYMQPPRMISAGKTAYMLLANGLTAGDAARKRDPDRRGCLTKQTADFCPSIGSHEAASCAVEASGHPAKSQQKQKGRIISCRSRLTTKRF